MKTQIKKEYVTDDGAVFDNEEDARKHEDCLKRDKVYFDGDADAYEYIVNGVSFCEEDHEDNEYRLKQALAYLQKWYDAYLADNFKI